MEKSPAVQGSGELSGSRIEKAETEAEAAVEVSASEKNGFNPEKMGLEELDERVEILKGAMDGILKDAAQAGAELTKTERKKIKQWGKKGGKAEDWPMDDYVTPENYKKQLEKYDVAEYIDPSQIEKHRDAYAVVSKQYKIYNNALEKRIRKAKLKQLEEAEGKPSSKKEKQERVKEADVEIEAELPPEGAEMPWELKRDLGEESKVQDEDILEKKDLDATAEHMAGIRKDLDKDEEGWEEGAREFKGEEKFIETAVIKRKDIKGRKAASEKTKKELKKNKRKKGFFARLFEIKK